MSTRPSASLVVFIGVLDIIFGGFISPTVTLANPNSSLPVILPPPGPPIDIGGSGLFIGGSILGGAITGGSTIAGGAITGGAIGSGLGSGLGG